MINKVRTAVVKHVNDQRIIEMHEGGCGVHQIVGVFRDHNINTTPEYVQGCIDQHGTNYETKFLPKSAVSQAVATVQVFDSGMLPA
jgi:hypothetical protein